MISLSLKQAEKSTFTRARIGAVIVSAGRVVAKGHNKIRGSKTIKQKRWPSTLHAECDAILNAIKNGCYDDLKNATMFVSHIRPSGTIGNACPCSHCMAVIRGSGKFKRVVFDAVMHSPESVEQMEAFFERMWVDMKCDYYEEWDYD